jgi:lambda family phage portal protein
MGVASVIDRVINAVSPAAGLRRAMARDRLSRLSGDAGRQTMYAAAKTTRLTGSWATLDPGVNAVIGVSSVNVRNRVRQLVRDFPYFARAVRNIVDFTVGSGIMLQSKIEDADGNLDRKLNQAIEDAFAFWAEDADVAGKIHFAEMTRLAKRQDVESGEFLLVRRVDRNNGRYLPYQLQIYEADWLTTQFDRGYGPKMIQSAPPNTPQTDIYQGIEYDRSTGRIQGYYFTDPDGWGKSIRVDAADVIHGFETLRPGQLRGMSVFAPAVMVAHDLSEYMDAEIDAAKMAAKYLGFIKSPDPMGLSSGFTTATDPAPGDGDRKFEEMENALLKILLPGEEVTLASNPRPSGNLPPFVRMLLCMVAVTANMPYELLSGDYQGLSYSNFRMIRNDFMQSLKPTVDRHIRHMLQPIGRDVLQWAVITGKVRIPGFFSNPMRYYQQLTWQPPGMESPDPLRETKAMADQVQNLTRSPQEIAAARGRDLEDVYREIAAARKMAADMGLGWPGQAPSVAMANNPAAVEEQN